MTAGPLDRVTQLLRDRIEETSITEALPTGRDEAIARLANALRARGRAQRRSRVLSRMAVAAGVALVLGGGAWMARRAAGPAATARDLGRVQDSTGSVTALRDGHSETVGAGVRVAEGTELRTSASSEAHLDFDSGTRLTIGGAARVRLVEQSHHKRFSLEAGSLAAKVAKLAPDERFVVATLDTEVEVRGTAFRVTIVAPEAACAGGSPTRVDVTEGVVVVRHGGIEQRVAAGEQWPVCEGRPATKPTAPAVTAAVATVTPAAPATALDLALSVPASPATAAGSHGSAALSPIGALPGPAPEARSQLAAQNDLFDEAMRLKRSGEAGAAVAKLDRLLASYPSGPLAESASAERMRLLGSTDKARASAAAREYLRRHPRGFARAEAEAIAAGPR